MQSCFGIISKWNAWVQPTDRGWSTVSGRPWWDRGGWNWLHIPQRFNRHFHCIQWNHYASLCQFLDLRKPCGISWISSTCTLVDLFQTPRRLAWTCLELELACVLITTTVPDVLVWFYMILHNRGTTILGRLHIELSLSTSLNIFKHSSIMVNIVPSSIGSVCMLY